MLRTYNVLRGLAGRHSVHLVCFDQRHGEDPDERRRVAEARLLLTECNDFEKVQRDDTITAFETFLAKWPKGRHHAEAKLGLERVRHRRTAARTAPRTSAASEAPRERIVPETIAEVKPPPIVPLTIVAGAVPQKTLETTLETNVEPTRAMPQPQRSWHVLASAIATAVAIIAVIVLVWPKEELPLPPVELPGNLVIDARPWGTLQSIRDANGKEWMDGTTPRFTPISISVPPGHYKIQLANPQQKDDTRTIDASVQSTKTNTVSVEFERIDSAEYFRRQGWTQ